MYKWLFKLQTCSFQYAMLQSWYRWKRRPSRLWKVILINSGNVKLKWKKDILWDELKCHVKGIRILVRNLESWWFLDDPYILAGSCGVEFEVNKNHDYSTYNHHYSNSSFDWNPFSWITGFFNFIFFLVLIFFFVFMFGMNNIVRVM